MSLWIIVESDDSCSLCFANYRNPQENCKRECNKLESKSYLFYRFIYFVLNEKLQEWQMLQWGPGRCLLLQVTKANTGNIINEFVII